MALIPRLIPTQPEDWLTLPCSYLLAKNPWRPVAAYADIASVLYDDGSSDQRISASPARSNPRRSRSSASARAAGFGRGLLKAARQASIA